MCAHHDSPLSIMVNQSDIQMRMIVHMLQCLVDVDHVTCSSYELGGGGIFHSILSYYILL